MVRSEKDVAEVFTDNQRKRWRILVRSSMVVAAGSQALTPAICTVTETLCMSWPPLDQQQQTNMQHLHSYATIILRKLSREHMSLCKYQIVRLQAVKLRHDIP